MARATDNTRFLRKRRNEPTKATPGSIVLMIVLFVYSLALILMLLWGLNTSLKGSEDYGFFGNKIGLPNPENSEYPLYYNYFVILSAFKYTAEDNSYISSIFGYIENLGPANGFAFGDFFFNSLIYCFFGAFSRTFVAFTAGFLVSKYRYKFSKFIYVLMLVILAIPIVGSVPSMIKVTRDLAIYDSYAGMILLNLNFTGLYFFVFAAYFQEYSDVYLEASEIDGASQFRTFFSIVFPMAAKLFWTVFLLNFIALWNDYQTPLLYYPNHPTLSYGIFRMYSNSGASARIEGFGPIETPQRIAGCMILAIPVLILFLSTKKALLGNMTAGGIKE